MTLCSLSRHKLSWGVGPQVQSSVACSSWPCPLGPLCWQCIRTIMRTSTVWSRERNTSCCIHPVTGPSSPMVGDTAWEGSPATWWREGSGEPWVGWGHSISTALGPLAPVPLHSGNMREWWAHSRPFEDPQTFSLWFQSCTHRQPTS